MRTRIFISGPYSRPCLARNVHAAMQATHALMDLGYAPFCPHLSHFLELHHPRPYEEWMAVDLAWVIQSDAVLRLPGESPGADREYAAAARQGIPVFGTIEKLSRSVPPNSAEALQQAMRADVEQLQRIIHAPQPARLP